MTKPRPIHRNHSQANLIWPGGPLKNALDSLVKSTVYCKQPLTCSIGSRGQKYRITSFLLLEINLGFKEPTGTVIRIGLCHDV